MKLWTVQHIGAWTAARKRGYLTGDPKFAFADELIEPMWRRSYDWMCAQMRKRLPRYSGDLPVWGWPKPPDFSRYHVCACKPHVLLHFEVPDRRALASDFGLWHSVLNDWYLSRTEIEDEIIGECFTATEKVASWEHIFDFTRSELERDWLGKPDAQVCVDHVYLSEVKRAAPVRHVKRCRTCPKRCAASRYLRPEGN